ncbi:hypothetical protein Gotur_020312 [Gossypium turneri]
MSYPLHFRKTFSGIASPSPPSFLPSFSVENTARSPSLLSFPLTPHKKSFIPSFPWFPLQLSQFSFISSVPSSPYLSSYRSKRSQFSTTIYFYYIHSNFRQICGKF